MILSDQLVTIKGPPNQRFSNTLNGYGWVFHHFTSSAVNFIKHSSVDNPTMLEIGGSFSNVALNCMHHGSPSRYVLNDLSSEHLQANKAKLIDFFDHSYQQQVAPILEFLPGRCPAILTDLTYQFDAILIDQVIHFFTPTDVEQLFTELKRMLAPGGKVYITTESVYHQCHPYEDIAEYFNRKEAGMTFCGVFNTESGNKQRENLPNISLPKKMLYFAMDDLVAIAESFGFKTNDHQFLRLPEDDSGWQQVDEKNCDQQCLTLSLD